MVNYNLGKVYKIEPISGGEEGDVYVGSTAIPMLCTRMAQHRSDYRGWKDGKRNPRTSGILFEKYGVDNCHIVILESINAETKDELFACERKWIQSHKCVNNNISGRTQQQYYQDNRVIYQQYRDQHKVHKQQYDKKYKDASPMITCECGSVYKQFNRSIHVKSFKHKQFITNIKSGSIV